MPAPIQFGGEDRSNAVRNTVTESEPLALRTFTPSQAVLARSAGPFHWTPEGRKLYDYTSGVLVANLGHNPRRWLQRFGRYLQWPADTFGGEFSTDGEYVEAVAMTAYNALTEIEAQANSRLLRNLHAFPGSERLQQVMWAASGSEAVQKALWACLHCHQDRDVILATRHGFHGKKGLAGAVTGTESDPDRDPRVRFISFPGEEVDDVSRYDQPVSLEKYEAELAALADELGDRINCLITEPYLGGGGSYHPPAEYLQLLQRFCREHGIFFVLDEVQSNFGRTGCMYAFEKYGIEPDLITLGKGMGNGVPVSAAVGPREVLASLKYGEASDTWSANPISCASVLATLDEFEQTNVMANARLLSPIFFDGLQKLKQTGLVAKVRGEGMVFGIECAAVGSLTSQETAIAIVRACYLGGEDGTGLHFLGPLAGNVLRVSPPMTLTEQQAHESLALLLDICENVAKRI